MSQQHQHCRNCGQRIWYRALNAAYVHEHSLSIWCGRRPLCDVYHGGLVPPEADVDFRRRRRLAGIPGEVRYLCDHHARGYKGWRDPKFRLTPMAEPKS